MPSVVVPVLERVGDKVLTGEQHESLREHAASLPAGESGAICHLSRFFTFGLEANSTWRFALWSSRFSLAAIYRSGNAFRVDDRCMLKV